jgi:hypothetical protein
VQTIITCLQKIVLYFIISWRTLFELLLIKLSSVPNAVSKKIDAPSITLVIAGTQHCWNTHREYQFQMGCGRKTTERRGCFTFNSTVRVRKSRKLVPSMSLLYRKG